MKKTDSSTPTFGLPGQTNDYIGKYGLLHLDSIKAQRKGRLPRFSPEAAYNYGVDNYIHGDDFAIVTI